MLSRVAPFPRAPWSGFFEVGELLAGYLGPLGANTPHAHVALQIVIALAAEITVRVEGETLADGGVVIGPMVSHAIGPAGSPALVLYLEPQGRWGRAALKALAGRRLSPLDATIARGLREATTRNADFRELADLLGSGGPVDPRLARALGWLRGQAPTSGDVSRAAGVAGLSTSRLRALAQSDLGVSLGRWMLWRKLAASARLLKDGSPLVDAALASGFADQAHLSRTMRRQFGVTAATAAALLSRTGINSVAGRRRAKSNRLASE